MESWREELYHHGIKGQKWGVRRFQNEDGTLTEDGKKRRYSVKEVYDARKKLNSEREKLKQLEKKKSDIESDIAYRDDIRELEFDARDAWDDKNNRMVTDEESKALWDKYDKAYQKALSSNKEYPKVLKDLESKRKTVKELEKMASTKTGKDYAKIVLSACGSIALATASIIAIDYLMSSANSERKLYNQSHKQAISMINDINSSIKVARSK